MKLYKQCDNHHVVLNGKCGNCDNGYMETDVPVEQLVEALKNLSKKVEGLCIPVPVYAQLVKPLIDSGKAIKAGERFLNG